MHGIQADYVTSISSTHKKRCNFTLAGVRIMSRFCTLGPQEGVRFSNWSMLIHVKGATTIEKLSRINMVYRIVVLEIQAILVVFWN